MTEGACGGQDAVDGKATAAWQLTSNYTRWLRSKNGVDDNDNKQQSTNVRRQRCRTMTAGERQQMNNNSAADKQWQSTA